MTPDPTGIEALLCELEALRERAPMIDHHGNIYRLFGHGEPERLPQCSKYVLALHDAFPALAAALKSQSRALAEREETIGRLREELGRRRKNESRLSEALRPFAIAATKDKGRLEPRPGDWVMESDWDEAAEALASAPKGEGEG